MSATPSSEHQCRDGARRFIDVKIVLTADKPKLVGLRILKLMVGGKRARREAVLMVGEKVDEAVRAGASLMAGASGEGIVRRYRRRVAANAKRLGKLARVTPLSEDHLDGSKTSEGAAPRAAGSRGPPTYHSA